MRLLSAFASCVVFSWHVVGQPQGEAQKIPPPNWLSDDGKDLFNEIEEDSVYYGDGACDAREKLLKLMAGKSEQGAADHRVRVLLGLGLCELRKANWDKAMLRFESTLSEMNAPSDDALLKNQQFAPFVLMKQAASYLKRHEITQGGTQLRRGLEVSKRNIKNVLKAFHKQIEQQQQGGAPPLEMLTAEISGFGKTGQYMPMLVKQYPIFKQELQQLEVLEGVLDELDKKIELVQFSQKQKRVKLDVSKGKSQQGSLMYVRALAAGEPVVDGEKLLAAKEVEEKKVTKAFLEEADASVKAGTLIKRTKDGSACKSLPKTCEAVKNVADIQSNVFGETRVAIVKAGKEQPLDSCTTNANVGILVSAKEGVKVSVGKTGEPTMLKAGKPVVVDFCLEVSLHADTTAPVLFMQAWHPEFAAVERTSELRARAKAFGLTDAEVKAATQVVNDYAKKFWDKASTHWRKSSSVVEKIREESKKETETKKEQAEAAAEAKRKEDEASDEDRKKNLAELERKRAERRQKEEEAEKKRLERKKQLEAERANRDPWLNSPEVLAAEKNLAELKEARRDANAKLEFDLSTQLTKDIGLAERNLAKVIKTAKKAHKKGLSSGGSQQPAKESSKTDKSKGEDLASLKQQLEDVKAQKAKASENEDFAEAKRLKDKQKELEAKLKSQGSGNDAASGLKKEIEDVKKKKAKASEDEDFAEAKRLKQLQQDLEAKLKKLEL